MPRSRTVTIAALTLTLLASACGGGDDSAAEKADPTDAAAASESDDTGSDASDTGADDDEPMADLPLTEALAAQLRADPDSPIRTDEEATCLSEAVVDRIGEDRLQEVGVSAAGSAAIEDLDFTADELSVIVEVMFDCIDVRERIAEVLATQFGEEPAACIAEELDEDTMGLMISLAFSGGIDASLPPEFLEMFIALMGTCGVDMG